MDDKMMEAMELMDTQVNFSNRVWILAIVALDAMKHRTEEECIEAFKNSDDFAIGSGAKDIKADFIEASAEMKRNYEAMLPLDPAMCLMLLVTMQGQTNEMIKKVESGEMTPEQFGNAMFLMGRATRALGMGIIEESDLKAAGFGVEKMSL